MKLHFFGATRQVTGSRFCLETSQRKVLIDCGMFQEREFAQRNWESFPIPAADIDAVLLTHVHIDHCGLLPRLAHQGFAGPIWTTRPSADLIEIMLEDAAKIQMEDLAYKQKRHRRERRSSPYPYEPLFDEKDVREVCSRVQAVPLGRATSVTDDLEVTFQDAGHILGSASLTVTHADPGSQPTTIVFSGDVGQVGKPLVRDPVRPREADFLVMESTYGDRLHQDAGDVIDQLERIIHDTVQRGGKIVVPTFAVERAQELIYLLSQLVHSRRVPPIPVFLDSPMAVDVTSIFRRHADSLDEEALAMLTRGTPPLRFPGLQMSRSTAESKAINSVAGPAMILSTSGMCNAGRIKHHLRNYIGDPNSTIVFVGYQAVGTLGRLILDGHDPIRIHGKQHRVKARIAQIFGFSGHADRDGLLHWIGAFDAPPRRTFLVHGEEEAALSLAERMRKKGWDVGVPHYQETVEL